MKVAVLAVLSVLIALPAEAGQRHRQNNVSPSCNNEGRCTTLNVTAPTSSKAPSLRRTSERKTHRAVDANGNSMMVTAQTAYGFNITVHPAYASKFLKFYALLKERGYKVDLRINKCFSRGGHVPGSNHYIGAACDNQYGWNKAPSYMYHVGDLIRQAGLYDGCRFGDCGHVEAVRGTHNRRPISMPPSKNSNQSNRQLTTNHERWMNCGMSTIGPKRASVAAPHMSAFEGKADIVQTSQNVR